MTTAATAAFDRQVADLLATCYPDGTLQFEVIGRITWGTPRAPSASQPG